MFVTLNRATEQLSLSRTAVLNLVAAGQIRRRQATGTTELHAEDVQRVSRTRRRQALSRIPDLGALAEAVRLRLRPRPMAGGLTGGRDAIGLLSVDARAVFGLDVLTAACMADQPGYCRWCWSRMSASVHGTPAPEDLPAYGILLGPQCPKDVAHFNGVRDARRLETKRRNSDASRQRAQLAEMRRKLDVQTGASMVASGRQLIEAATPQKTGMSRLDPESLAASARALTTQRAQMLDEQLERAERRGDIRFAAHIRALKRSL